MHSVVSSIHAPTDIKQKLLKEKRAIKCTQLVNLLFISFCNCIQLFPSLNICAIIVSLKY